MSEPKLKCRGIVFHADGKSIARSIPFPPPAFIEGAPKKRAAALPVGGRVDFYHPQAQAVVPRKKFALVSGTFEVKRPEDLAIYVEVEEP